MNEVRSESAEILIIDEVFAYVDARLKQIKGSCKGFGGM